MFLFFVLFFSVFCFILCFVVSLVSFSVLFFIFISIFFVFFLFLCIDYILNSMWDRQHPWSPPWQVMVALLECSSLEIAALALELWGGLGNLLSDASRGPQGQRSFPLEEFVKHACRVAMLRARQPTPEEGGLAGLDPDARDELEDFRQQVRFALEYSSIYLVLFFFFVICLSSFLFSPN